MHQVKLFTNQEEINDWLCANSNIFKIVDIKFCYYHSTYRYLVHYMV